MSDIIRHEKETEETGVRPLSPENRPLSPMLEIRNYTKIYGEKKKAADDVSLSVEWCYM